LRHRVNGRDGGADVVKGQARIDLARIDVYKHRVRLWSGRCMPLHTYYIGVCNGVA